MMIIIIKMIIINLKMMNLMINWLKTELEKNTKLIIYSINKIKKI